MSDPAASPTSHFLRDLARRGLIAQTTDDHYNMARLDAHLSQPETNPRRAYAGFDPTADSLTIGNLVPIMLLLRFQCAGHVPIVLMGGGTGLIGDPSGKAEERALRTPEEVRHNVERQRTIFENIWQNAPHLMDDQTRQRFARGPKAPTIVNNIDWLGKLSYIDALRDVGKHFSVNMMMQKDSVRERLHNRDQGISYTEFSYMILQAYDFAHLAKADGVSIQLGGSDQFGNIVAGTDLIRKQHARPGQAEDDAPTAFGLTTPLITKADGSKFGKTESGAIWLTPPQPHQPPHQPPHPPSRTSPTGTSAYTFYQFWLNAADADLPTFLRTFTLFSEDRIAELLAAHEHNPGAREAHRALAQHMTDLLHGRESRQRAESAAGALFSGDISQLSLDQLEDVFASAPSSEHDKCTLADGMPLADLLAQTTLADSKSSARKLLQQGSVSVNGTKADPETTVTADTLMHGSIIALRRGKKAWHITRWG